jgi:hypothetical protein
METSEIEINARVRDINLTQAQIDKLEAKQARIDNLQGFTEDLEKWSNIIIQGASSGDIIGATGTALSSSGNPYAMAAGAVVSAFGGIAQLGELAKDSSVQEVSEGIIQSAEEQIENIERGMEVFEAVLPELLTMIITELPLAIIKAIPDLAMGLYEAMVMALREFWNGIKGIFSKRTDEEKEANKQARHDWANQYLSDFWGLITGDSYASGTSYVQRTGMALLHKGEAVIPQNGRAAQGIQAGISAPVNINISASVIDRDVIPRLVREIERVTGKYGRMQSSFT